MSAYTEERPAPHGLRLRLLPAWVALLVYGCTAVPTESPRLKRVQDADLGLGPGTSVVIANWWRSFGDPHLDELVVQGLSRNPDLDQALARVRLAQAQTGLANAERAPQVGLDGTASYQRFSENDVIPPPYAGRYGWQESAQAALSWSLDLWGRQAALLRQASRAADAAGLSAQASRLAVTGSIVVAYIDLDRAYAAADLGRQSEALSQRLVTLTSDRIRAGLETPQALRRAQVTLSEARISVDAAEGVEALQTQMLAALIGTGVLSPISRPHLTSPTSVLPAQLPIDLLAHRPDVIAARLQVEAALAGRAVARADFYPNVDLRAFAGLTATRFGVESLFEAGSRVYGVGPAVHLPLFDGGVLKARYRESVAMLDLTIATYNQTVLGAVKDAAGALTSLRALDRQTSEARTAVERARAVWDLAQSRYASGLSDYLPVIDADNTLLTARRKLIDLQHDRLVAYARLNVALGGGFDRGTDEPHSEHSAGKF